MTFSAQFEIVEFVSLIFMESDIQLIQTEFKSHNMNLRIFRISYCLVLTNKDETKMIQGNTAGPYILERSTD